MCHSLESGNSLCHSRESGNLHTIKQVDFVYVNYKYYKIFLTIFYSGICLSLSAFLAATLASAAAMIAFF